MTFSTTTAVMVSALAINSNVAGVLAAHTTPPARMLADPITGTISFPLTPHHVQRRRLGLSEEELALEDEKFEDLRKNRRNHNRKNRNRNRSLADNNDHHLVMGGLYMGYGTHYVDLWCGTPNPQRQTVIVDTGSSQTAFPCKECVDCGSPKYHAGELFDQSLSKTFHAMSCIKEECSQRSDCNEETDQCEIEQYYSEGSSWFAYEAKDLCYIGGYHNTGILLDDRIQDGADPGHAKAFEIETRIGCQTEVTGLFKTQLADGIMGMCDAKQSFWHQLYRAHKIREKKFSLCYVRPPHTSKEGTPAGAITLGGTDERLHDVGPMVYTSLVGTSSEKAENEGHSGYYDIHIREMYLREGKGGASATSSDASASVIKVYGAGALNDEGGVIVDSGTTDTYFHETVKKQLIMNWEKLAGEKWSHEKHSRSPEDVAKLPTVLIQFAGDVEANMEVAKRHGGGDPNKIVGLAGDLDKNFPYDVIVAIPPIHYMEALKDGEVTNRIYATEDDGSVIGANALMGHDVMFDASTLRVGWAESSCDYAGIVEDKHYTSAMAEVVEDDATIKEEDKEEEKQETEKDKFDQKNTNNEIEQDNANIEDLENDGGSVTEFNDEDPKHFTKNSHNIEIPVDDMLESPEILGICLAFIFLTGIFCAYTCCAPSQKQRRRRKKARIELKKRNEIEMNNRRFAGGYRDDFRDEDSDVDSSDDEEDAVDKVLSGKL